jgi:fluoroquinolone transport system permease protein
MRLVGRDAMLFFYLLAPLLLISAVKFGVPAANDVLTMYFQFDLSDYYGLITGVSLLLVSLILGCMCGFMMLDERDDHLIQYYAVTPLSRSGYLICRLATAVALSITYDTILLLLAAPESVTTTQVLYLLPMAAFEAPIIALFLVAFAANKVEGLALSKGASLIVAIPAAAWFIHSPLKYGLGIFPPFWIYEVLHRGYEEGPWRALLLTLIGLSVHLLAVYVMLRKFLRRQD